jgi:hypothetical protein
MNVPGCGIPAVRPDASVLSSPLSVMVFDPASDRSGNVMPCLSLKAFSVSTGS